jgi:hypothetical protein
MRRVESEVSLTDMILANTKIPKSKSMVSLPQALASTIESFSCSQSKLACQQYMQANTQGFNQFNENENRGLLENCRSTGRRGSSSSVMAIYNRANHSTSSSRQTDHPRKQNESERESHHTASTRESFSNDTYDSKTMKKDRGQRKRKVHIRKIDANSTYHLQAGPIPKWIHIEINQNCCSSSLTCSTTQDSSGLRLEQRPSNITMQHADLMPLSELAMLMSHSLSGAIEKGLFSPIHRCTSADNQQVRENTDECDREC